MSSGSDSDDEYVPGEPEQVSEEGSADEETDLQYEKEHEIKTQKRKAAQESKSKKKRRTRNTVKEPTPEPKEKEPETNLNPVEEKKREEDLWAKFLAGTGSASKAPAKETVKQPEKSETVNKVAEQPKPQAKTSSVQDELKAREQRIFQFAGETIVVENNIIKEKIKTAEASATVSKIVPQRSRGSGGLADVLGQLNKKNSLSTLEKSKLDWETYKKEEDINEEIQSHNKGKNGYLERQDFLERADHRQYEIERDMRLSRRSNR